MGDVRLLNSSVLKEQSRERPSAETPGGLVCIRLEGAADFPLVLFLPWAAWQDPEYEPQQVESISIFSLV